MTTSYTLTPADVMELRASVRWRLSDQTLSIDSRAREAAFVVACAADPMSGNTPAYTPDSYALHAYGHLQAVSTRIELLGACLRCEAAEPGFIRRILDAREDVELAALTPDLAAAERSRRLFEQKAAREAEDERQRNLEAARRRQSAARENPSDFILNFSDDPS